ncbi:MAG TPA: hypothetical protein VFW62_03115, partial [bacterium]|nr:hypothetical protein [bacterium]
MEAVAKHDRILSNSATIVPKRQGQLDPKTVTVTAETLALETLQAPAIEAAEAGGDVAKRKREQAAGIEIGPEAQSLSIPRPIFHSAPGDVTRA